jgi:serine/threonine-protein kinase
MPLAAGGMARIYIGRSTGIGQFERHVVLKMITPERANDMTAVNMFLDEARLAASLNHQNVGQVFEVGEEGGIHYLAMEYVHGQDLRAVLAKAGSAGTRIPLELALTVVAGAAAGLNHAHERRAPDGTPLGIVHRDVSPSNIMIGYDGAVKLLDFGIAKAAMRSVETQSGIIKGKFAYMAPEQCRGRDVDRRSDVFSLGIILYEISTQHRCFRADSDFDTMHRIVTGDVVRPTRLVQGYPQALEAIVMKALAVDAGQRYQSAGLLLEALESFAVASRMSLSTMGLGRFMRDMFGEVQEPWLNASMRMAAATPPKENTISSTGSRNQQPTTPVDLVPSSGAPTDDDDDDGRFEDSDQHEAAKTLLQLPSGMNGDDIDGPGWNPRSYPSGQSNVDSDETLPPQAQNNQYANKSGTLRVPPTAQSGTHRVPPGVDPRAPITSGMGNAGAPSGRLTPPQISAQGTQPMPMGNVPQNQFPQQHTPGSGSSPAHPALITPGGGVSSPIVSTKHGYASGAGAITRGDVSYPRYDPPADAAEADVQLKPNRRPLFIGLGVVLLGVVVMVIVMSGGSKDDSSNQVTPGSGSETGDTTVKMGEQNTPKPTPVDETMITLIIESDPQGADVLIAGAKIGVTPFNGPLKRGSKVVQLTVHMEGYVDYTKKIDLGAEYENRNIKLVKVEDAKGSAGATGDTTGDDQTGASTGSSGSTNTGTTGSTTGTAGTTGTGTTNTGTTTNTGAKTGTTGTTGAKTGTTGAKTGTTGAKTGGTTGAKTGTGTTPKKAKCQLPGPNVDPFGAPVCKPGEKP